MFQSITFPYEEELRREINLRNLSERTFKNYKSHLRRLAEFWSTDIKEISISQCKEYLYHLTAVCNQGDQNINVCRSAFLFFHSSVLNDPIDPRLLPYRKISHPLPTILQQDQILALLDSVVSLKYRAILSLCYGSGLRISEAHHVRISDINSQKMRLFVKGGKGKKDRYTILSLYSLALLRSYFKMYKPNGPFLFPGRSPNKPIAVQATQAVFREAVSDANLSRYGKITIHTLRHCFATHLLDAGCSLRPIQLFLGHKNIETTCIYLQLTDQHMAKVTSPIDRKDGDFLAL